jgi:hypothetical protein
MKVIHAVVFAVIATAVAGASLFRLYTKPRTPDALAGIEVRHVDTSDVTAFHASALAACDHHAPFLVSLEDLDAALQGFMAEESVENRRVWSRWYMLLVVNVVDSFGGQVEEDTRSVALTAAAVFMEDGDPENKYCGVAIAREVGPPLYLGSTLNDVMETATAAGDHELLELASETRGMIR